MTIAGICDLVLTIDDVVWDFFYDADGAEDGVMPLGEGGDGA